MSGGMLQFAQRLLTFRADNELGSRALRIEGDGEDATEGRKSQKQAQVGGSVRDLRVKHFLHKMNWYVYKGEFSYIIPKN